MIGALIGSGFLGTPATFAADLSLIVTTVAAILVIVGWRLAVARRYTAHHWVQVTATVLIAAVALTWMLVSFIRYVVPELPGILSDVPYALTTVHAIIGAVAVLVGLFIILRFSRATPKEMRRRRAKSVMRAALVLYLVSWALGVAIYVVLYVGV